MNFILPGIKTRHQPGCGAIGGKSWRVLLIALSVVMVVLPAVALAALGDYDTTFGDPNVIGGTVLSVVVQDDGKILIGGGFSSVGGEARYGVARLNADGTLDTTFGDPNVIDGSVLSVAVQGDGKILIGGGFDSVGGEPRNGVTRLNADGTLDTTFGDTNPNNTVESVVVQDDGKILICGSFYSVGGEPRNGVTRLNADGTLDTTFRDPNLEYYSASGDVYSVAVQGDGKILIGGHFNSVGGEARYKVARLNANGTVDTTFNTMVNGDVYSVAVQGDGKILISGNFYVGVQTREDFVRVYANGTVDTTFNTMVVGDVYSVAVQGDGKILIGGNFYVGDRDDPAYVARLSGATPPTTTTTTTTTPTTPTTPTTTTKMTWFVIAVGLLVLTIRRWRRNNG